MPNKYTPHTERELNGGVQKLYSFPNGYGASVIRHRGSYGSSMGLWELAVLHNGVLCYETHITSDVLGHLTNEHVEQVLAEIEALTDHRVETPKDVKPFLLFAFDVYYPGGGWHDFEGSFATLAEALKATETLRYEKWQIVDLSALPPQVVKKG